MFIFYEESTLLSIKMLYHFSTNRAILKLKTDDNEILAEIFLEHFMVIRETKMWTKMVFK